MVLVPLMPEILHSNPVSSLRSPDALEPATDEVDLIVSVPLHLQSTDVEKMVSSRHVVEPALLPKNILPDAEVPSALVVISMVANAHFQLKPLESMVSLVLVEVPLRAVLTGVILACAGDAATASAVSMAAVSRRPRVVAGFM